MSMPAFARDVASRLHHRGALIERGHADVAADLREIANVNMAEMRENFAARQLEILAGYGFQPVEQSKPFAYADGVAIIPIHGMLINRMSWSYSFATGYDFIRSQMNAALSDDDVKLIVYDINSSGGLASGCAELSAEIFASRETKPSLSVVDARCYSAAYFLGSAASRVVVTPSGGVGSIGCVAMHVDFSVALEHEGIKVTFIFEGDEKVDGNSYEPLSNRAKDSIKRDVTYHYGLFVEAVARQRGLSEDEVRATEARCYLPPEALELGLIDGVQTPIDAVAEFFNDLTSDSDDAEDDDIMDTKQQNGGTSGAATPPAFTLEDVARVAAEAATTAATAASTAAIAAAFAQRDEAQSRGNSIRALPEAKGKEKLADHLASNTSMSIDDAKAVLTAAAPEAANTRQEPNNYFASAMDNTKNPNVGGDPGAGDGGGQDQPGATASRLLTNFAAMTGQKVIPIGGSRSAA